MDTAPPTAPPSDYGRGLERVTLDLVEDLGWPPAILREPFKFPEPFKSLVR
jgi:hypothetical protein